MCVINKNERNGHFFFAAVQGLILFSFNVMIRPVLLQGGHQGCRYTGLSLRLDQPKESETYSKSEITGLVSVKMLMLQRIARLLVPACVTSGTCGERVAWNRARIVAYKQRIGSSGV